MHFLPLLKIFGECVDEFFPLEKGVKISDPRKAFLFCDARITRKQIKHIVEQRKSDGKSPGEIKTLFCHMLGAIEDFDFELPNRNPRHIGSIMRIKIFRQGDGVIIVMGKMKGGLHDLLTVFIRNSKGIKTLVKKGLQKSASGETPRSEERSSH